MKDQVIIRFVDTKTNEGCNFSLNVADALNMYAIYFMNAINILFSKKMFEINDLTIFTNNKIKKIILII